MRLLTSSDNTKLTIARSYLEEGTPDDVIIRAEAYVALLEEHLLSLRSLKGVPKVSFAAQSRFAGLLVEQVRSSIRTEIESATNERNRIKALLESLTVVTGWASVQTLNQQTYRDACDWELVGTSVRSASVGISMTIQETVTEAIRLRREAFFAVRKAA